MNTLLQSAPRELMGTEGSRSPVSNLTGWIAFCHDFLHALKMISEPVFPAERPVRLDILREEVEAPEPCSCDWQTDDAWKRREYWTKRLDALRQQNDDLFPDDHLLDAWSLFFAATEEVGGLWGWAKNEADFWSQELTNTDAASGSWLRFARLWKRSDSRARYWLAPLVEDLIANRIKGCSRLTSARTVEEVLSCNERHCGRNGEEERGVQEVDGEAWHGFPFSVENNNGIEEVQATVDWLNLERQTGP